MLASNNDSSLREYRSQRAAEELNGGAPEPPDDRLTRVLESVRGRDMHDAIERLLPVVYEDLHRMARAQMRAERSGHTLQTTAVVNEAYLRLLGGAAVCLSDRRHFFAAAARAMRQILVDHARARGRIKRGGNRLREVLGEVPANGRENPSELLALDEALRRLEEQDERAAEVVRLRFFAGLDVAETADVLGVSTRTVKREWAFARAWLHDALQEGPPDGR